MKKSDEEQEGWSARKLAEQGAYKDLTDMKQRLRQGDDEGQSTTPAPGAARKNQSTGGGEAQDEESNARGAAKKAAASGRTEEVRGESR